MSWQPSAALSALQARARMNHTIRQFFYEREVLEVETPLLSQAAVVDPNIEPMQTQHGRWLHTSPEYAMKRLLCAGSGDIYQLTKVFRHGEAGRKHNPEFTMLEWYRVAVTLRQLQHEVADLFACLLAPRYLNLPVLFLTYDEAMRQSVHVAVHEASDEEISELAIALAGHDLHLTRDGWLDVIMSHAVEPSLPKQTLVFIDDFPASQAALARVERNQQGQCVARRFELFFNGVELANGYHELTDADEQRQRFMAQAEGRPLDEHLLSALAQGPLPDCCGVAMGLDRVLMLQQDAQHIADVLSFDWSRA